MSNDTDFLYEIGTMRYLQRTWRQFLNPDFANVAEHTLRVMWIALLLARREKENGAKIDEEKLLKMALVHDVCETRAGDANFLHAQYSEKQDEAAVAATLADAPFADMEALWQAYKSRDSLEAKLVKDADALDCDLEITEQRARGVKFPEDWGIRRYVYENKLYTQSAKKLWGEIQNSDPFDWTEGIYNKFENQISPAKEVKSEVKPEVKSA